MNIQDLQRQVELRKSVREVLPISDEAMLKARGHKYIKRERKGDKWIYWYKDASGKMVEGKQPSVQEQTNNPFNLYSDHKEFTEANRAIMQEMKRQLNKEDGSVEEVLRVAKNYSSSGADDSDSRQAIKDFWNNQKEKNKDLEFKPSKSSDISGTSLNGYVTTNYKTLVDIFGKPRNTNTGDRVSTIWVLKDKNNNTITLYDYKETNKYDKSLPSVSDFRNKEEYKWHIGAKNPEHAKRFKEFLETKLKP